jgi:CRISPR-associated endonuclease Csn1
MLLEECKCQDPYSGDQISPGDLFGTNPRFDVEHIYPKSLTGDSSFSNLTLCRKDYNSRKNNRTPKAAFGDTAEYQEMLVRVKSFNKNKAERFQQDNVPPEFQNRMLNDTSYIATAAVKYLATLYGGIIEKGIHHVKNVQRIFVVPGQATARLRRLWGLNGILGPNALKNPDILTEENPTQATGANDHKTKYRADHRHHAIDGFVIANCTPDIIKRWATEEEKRDSARIKNEERYRLNIPSPYGDCFPVVKEIVDAIIVSHRGDQRLWGELHNETFEKAGAKKKYKVEIAATEQNPVSRNFKQGDNHHIEVFEQLGKWKVEVVTLYTAHQRKRFGSPVIDPKCKFALHKGDFVKIYKNALDKQADRNGEVFMIVGIEGECVIGIQHHTDARPWDKKFTKEYQEKYGTVIRASLPSLKDRLVPYSVDVLGR